MSETNAAPAAVIAPTVPVPVSRFAEAVAMAHHAAATAYHGIVAIESDVAAWTSSAGVKPLIDAGVSYLERLLAANGVPVAVLGTAWQGFMGALGAMAAQDVTVPSGGSATGVLQSVPAVAAATAAPAA